MKKWFTLLSLSMSLSGSLASCQQEDLPVPAFPVCRLDSIEHIFDEFTYSETYGYAPDGSLKSFSPSPSNSRRYVCDGSKRVIESIISENYPAPHQITYELAGNGLATQSYYRYSDEESNTVFDTTYYTFNPEGYLTKKVLKRTIVDYKRRVTGRFETVTTLVLRNGNTLEERVASAGSYGTPEPERVAVRYEYDQDQPQQDDRSKPRWMGKASKHLLKSATYYSGGTVLSTKAYRYQLNEKGYVATATVNGNKLKYYYTCL